MWRPVTGAFTPNSSPSSRISYEGGTAMSDYQYPAALPVTTTGGWARPGWWDILADAEKEGRFGPADTRELLDDYCQLAINDQEAAGLDILTDGEHRRGGWIEGITGKMTGLALRPPPRKLGAIGWDMLPVYEVREPLEAVESIWDFTGEYRFLAARTSRRPKIGMPGPYGITTELDFSSVYRTRRDCAQALVPAIRADIQRLVAAGCDYIQIEEPLTPSHAAEDRTPENLVALINQVVDGITGCTFVVHICFGSFRRLPYAKRTYRWLFPALLDANVHGFSLEFGAREMAEIDLVGNWDRERILSAGLIDIKTHYSETPEDIIERVRTCLEYRDPERLEISTDCGLRRVPRPLAISKMSAAAEAARRLRQTGLEPGRQRGRVGQRGCRTAGQPRGESGERRGDRNRRAGASDLPSPAGVAGGHRERRAIAARRAAGRDVVEQRGQEIRGQVCEGRPGGQVDGVHVHLADPHPRDLFGGAGQTLGGDHRRLPGRLRQRVEVGGQRGRRRLDPGPQLGGGPRRARRDVGVALLRRGVHPALLAGPRPVDEVAQRAGVGGEVGEQVAAGPAGQRGRRGEGFVRQLREVGEQPLGAVLHPGQRSLGALGALGALESHQLA